MKILNLVQGSPEWHAHRTQYFNASEASIMLGDYPNVKRTDLITIRATGIASEVSWFLQKIFDDGHRFEALARPLAEEIIGEDLYPCVGVEGRLSASFDGLTLMEDAAFEHKTLNQELRDTMFDGCTGADLPIFYQEQMEQQCMVSGASRVLFMASEWEGDRLIEKRQCWYTPNPELRARIIAGWEQFARDVADYQPIAIAPAPVGRAPDQLPALRIEVTGMVTASNLAEFKSHAMDVLGAINRNLKTDEDFASAEQTVKWAKDVEDRLEAAKQHALSQTSSIDTLFRTIDDIAAETRRIRLDLDRQVTAEKQNRRTEIVSGGVNAVRVHYAEINATLGQHALVMPPNVQTDIGAAIKGKKTLASIHDAVNVAVSGAKISASQQAERIRVNMAVLDEHSDHASLFADRVTLCAAKSPEDLRNLVTARIDEHRRREDAKREAEELAAAKPLRVAVDMSTVATTSTEQVGEQLFVAHRPSGAQAVPVAQQRIKLGDINLSIAPLSITAEGLFHLGFQPVATERASKLYNVADMPAIYRAMLKVIESAAQPAVTKLAS
ncbi:hypothetical protein [Dyella caseinilytica]|uniref:Phage-type endonuclease n=1 Tax=Dyella caseinilytica TaxID=1849581 RepID=A0ABX7GXS6_9GAMM|nr:hypothetical protein [Dyella caseinilytica]QRN55217.1 hypothetical protein ISN74_07775 [Dyella caseinilytica]GGA00174.1 hypothetical protein GCM10011408_21300 [Dyella caseinilytica]